MINNLSKRKKKSLKAILRERGYESWDEVPESEKENILNQSARPQVVIK